MCGGMRNEPEGGFSLEETRCDGTFAEKARRTGVAGLGLACVGRIRTRLI